MYLTSTLFPPDLLGFTISRFCSGHDKDIVILTNRVFPPLEVLDHDSTDYSTPAAFILIKHFLYASWISGIS